MFTIGGPPEKSRRQPPRLRLGQRTLVREESSINAQSIQSVKFSALTRKALHQFDSIGEPQNLLPSMRQPEETTARAYVVCGVNIRTVRRQRASEIGPEVRGQQLGRVLKLET